MNEAAALLAAFLEATGRDAAIWETRNSPIREQALVASSSDAFARLTASGFKASDMTTWAATCGVSVMLLPADGDAQWLIMSSCAVSEQSAVEHASRHSAPDASAADRLLSTVVPMVRRLVRERDGTAHELAERYEEINLLYAVGELLGGAPSIEHVADTLLAEFASTLGASRAVLLETRQGKHALIPIALRGLKLDGYGPVALSNSGHPAVRAYMSGDACTETGDEAARGDPSIAADGASLMAVAITRPSTGAGITGTFPIPTRLGAEGMAVPLGVLVLARRPGAAPFSESDRKLAVAVGTQVGAAMHNVSLVRAAVERKQLATEMRLAQELQLKLLPDPSIVAPEARAAARVRSAEVVGGDFYLLARLDHDRTGVLIGDVSGHGYQAALIMALALSAAAIHLQAAFDPSTALEAVRHSLNDELVSTEMSVSLCYAVIDSRASELRFANAGHPHAFRLGADGQLARLRAATPPLGFSREPIEEFVMSWRAGDRLVFFTDGLADARNSSGMPLGEKAVCQTLSRMSAAQSPDTILNAVFAQLEKQVGTAALRDDCTVVVVDRP